jgi:hypothetical protein
VAKLLEPFAADVTLHAHNLKRRPLHVKCTPRVWLLLSGQYRTFKITRCVHSSPRIERYFLRSGCAPRGLSNDEGDEGRTLRQQEAARCSFAHSEASKGPARTAPCTDTAELA